MKHKDRKNPEKKMQRFKIAVELLELLALVTESDDYANVKRDTIKLFNRLIKFNYNNVELLEDIIKYINEEEYNEEIKKAFEKYQAGTRHPGATEH